jgi:hypothetical protein
LSKELFSVEEILKELHAAVVGLKAPGLGKTKIARLRGKIVSCKVYKELLVDEFAAILDGIWLRLWLLTSKGLLASVLGFILGLLQGTS